MDSKGGYLNRQRDEAKAIATFCSVMSSARRAPAFKDRFRSAAEGRGGGTSGPSRRRARGLPTLLSRFHPGPKRKPGHRAGLPALRVPIFVARISLHREKVNQGDKKAAKFKSTRSALNAQEHIQL